MILSEKVKNLIVSKCISTIYTPMYKKMKREENAIFNETLLLTKTPFIGHVTIRGKNVFLTKIGTVPPAGQRIPYTFMNLPKKLEPALTKWSEEKEAIKAEKRIVKNYLAKVSNASKTAQDIKTLFPDSLKEVVDEYIKVELYEGPITINDNFIHQFYIDTKEQQNLIKQRLLTNLLIT